MNDRNNAEALQTSELHHRRLFESARDGILIFDEIPPGILAEALREKLGVNGAGDEGE